MTSHAQSEECQHIQYGHGWPWPKRERLFATVYRVYQDLVADTLLIVAVDQDDSRRCVEITGELWCAVVRPRRVLAADGQRIANDDDLETILQAPEAWICVKPTPPIANGPQGSAESNGDGREDG